LEVRLVRERNRSATFRKGEPSSHVKAANNVCLAVEKIPLLFCSQREVISFPDGYEHEFDIIVRHMERGIVYFIEIGYFGDDTRHQIGNKSQMIKDGIAFDHVQKEYPNARYHRINKDDTYYPNFVLGSKCLCIYDLLS
jgi:hypothetical protein